MQYQFDIDFRIEPWTTFPSIVIRMSYEVNSGLTRCLP